MIHASIPIGLSSTIGRSYHARLAFDISLRGKAGKVATRVALCMCGLWVGTLGGKRRLMSLQVMVVVDFQATVVLDGRRSKIDKRKPSRRSATGLIRQGRSVIHHSSLICICDGDGASGK
jgi:hypothetical protein